MKKAKSNDFKFSELVSTLPEGISLAFGDPVSKTTAIVSLFIKGIKWFVGKNKEWIDSYSKECNLDEISNDDENLAKYVQFIRGIMIDISYETSETKREYCKKFALNYAKMIKENDFSEVIHYQTLLSRLNEGHLKLLIFMSNHKKMMGGKERYAPQPLNMFEHNMYANSPLIKEVGIPIDFIEPIISDLTSFGILEQRKKQNFLLLTFMGIYFVDYLVK